MNDIPRYITLLGVEEVSRAASRMDYAAQQMSRTVGYLSDILSCQRVFMDEWLTRLEQILTKDPPK